MNAVTVASEITPYVAAAIGAYGTAVLTRVTDAGADATVTLGQRILQRVRGSQEGAAESGRLDQALAEAAKAPEDFQVMLRVQIKKALLADAELTQDIARLLAGSAVTLTASGYFWASDDSVTFDTVSG